MHKLRKLKRVILAGILTAGVVTLVAAAATPAHAAAGSCFWKKDGEFWVWVCLAE